MHGKTGQHDLSNIVQRRTTLRTKLKIVASGLCLALFLLLCTLWARSYRWLDRVDWPIGRLFPGYTLATVSTRGLLMVGVQQEQNRANGGRSAKFRVTSQRVARINHIDPGILGFKIIRGPNEWGLQLPFWAAAPTVGFCAALPWVKWARRFSLRTLMIAMTLVALMLAAVAIANQVVNSR